MEEDKGRSEGGRPGVTGRRDSPPQPMEAGSRRQSSSEWSAREESGHSSKRPKNRDKRPNKDCQTRNGLKMVFTIFVGGGGGGGILRKCALENGQTETVGAS